MRMAGIIGLLLLAMILATGCVDRVERDLNIKNNANFPDSGGTTTQGLTLNERIGKIFGSIPGLGIGSTTGSQSAPVNDRQKAYEDLMKQMNEDSGTSQENPSLASTLPSGSNITSLSNETKNSTYNITDVSSQAPVDQQNSSTSLTPDSTTNLSSIKAQPNLLGDYSSFDSGITGWNPVNGTLTSDTFNPHDGKGDAKFVTSGSGNHYINYSVCSTVTAPNTPYTLSSWIATTSQGNNYVQVICHAANGTVIGVFNGTDVGSDNTYQRSTVTFTTPVLQPVTCQTVSYQTVHTQASADQAIIDQAVANEAAADQAIPGYIEIRVCTDGAGTSYVDSIKLEYGPQATNYLPQVDFSRIQKYPDVLDLGQFITYGPYGKEEDVTVYKYRIKSSFQIQYLGQYGGPVYQTLEAPDNQTFLFLYIETRYNGTEKFIDSPSPADFTILVNNVSYSYYTVDPSLMTDNQNWNNTYTIHDEFLVADYNGGVLTPGTVRQGMLIFVVPANAYSSDTVARLDIQYLSQWWKTPLWRLSPAPG